MGTNESTQGPKDPLPYNVKVQAMEALMPEIKGHIAPSKSLFTLASEIYAKHGKVNLNVYTDEQWLYENLVKYNGQEKDHGFYDFATITQNDTPRLSSATALRAAVKADDPKAFADAAGVPADLSIGGKPFFDLVKHYLGLQPEPVKKKK